MSYRYYATQRPPMPGCIPKGASEVVFLDERPLVEEIGDRLGLWLSILVN